MVNKCNNAFTLVEAMVSMIIIMIVTATLVPALTKVNPKIETVARRGQYACWFENGQLKEQYMDERTARRPAQVVDSCRLHLDQRPARYYIIATGAGNQGRQAQTVTKYITGIASDLDIKLGTTAVDNEVTTVKNSDTGMEEVRALGGAAYANGIMPLNVKGCNLLSVGEVCPNDISKVQEGCEVVELLGSSEYKDNVIRINGCDSQDDLGYVDRSNLIEFKDLRYTSAQTYFPDNANESQIANAALSDSDYYYYGSIRLNLDFADSSFFSKSQNISKMSQIVNMISIQRKSSLTELIAGLNAGAPNKNGAVLILW